MNKKRFKCCNGDNQKDNNYVLGESTIKTKNIKIFVDLAGTLGQVREAFKNVLADFVH